MAVNSSKTYGTIVMPVPYSTWTDDKICVWFIIGLCLIYSFNKEN